jgi:SAM-dependent methyltransferase
MGERYDSTAAEHYAAYRPPLHPRILERLVGPSEEFASGLDVGCGTGISSVALARHCRSVTGIDPSVSMLERAEPHPRVVYRSGTVAVLGALPGSPFDVVAFAGSLFYTKSEELRRGLLGLCREGAHWLVYDFEILLDPVLAALGVRVRPEASDYDHTVDLSDWDGFETVIRGRDRIRLEVRSVAMVHLLLSDSNRHDALAERHGNTDLLGTLMKLVERDPGLRGLEAEIHFSRHRGPGGGASAGKV